MGFCDYVTIGGGWPEHGLAGGSMCQSKSLYQAGGQFTITRDGKLVEHLFREEDDPGRLHPFTGFALPKRIPVGERVIDYHGDILLYCYGANGSSLELVASTKRFFAS